jgi:hypothetical protein
MVPNSAAGRRPTVVAGDAKVVVKQDFVGVVADKQWYALQAAQQLSVTWTAGDKLPNQAGLYDWMRQQPSADALVDDSADVDQMLGRAASTLKSTYLYPYQMHGPWARPVPWRMSGELGRTHMRRSGLRVRVCTRSATAWRRCSEFPTRTFGSFM